MLPTASSSDDVITKLQSSASASKLSQKLSNSSRSAEESAPSADLLTTHDKTLWDTTTQAVNTAKKRSCTHDDVVADVESSLTTTADSISAREAAAAASFSINSGPSVALLSCLSPLRR